jgi:hypothetical protein
MKPTCVIREEGTDTLVFDCAANCVECDCQGDDLCGDYEFTKEEKEEALLEYICTRTGKKFVEVK